MFRSRVIVMLAVLVTVAAASTAHGNGEPGLSRIHLEYCVYLSGEGCPSAIAAFELSFPEGSGVPFENGAAAVVDQLFVYDQRVGGCTGGGLLCAEPIEVMDNERKVCVSVTLDAATLPGGIFREFLQLRAYLKSLSPDREQCDLPEPSILRMYTNCIDPLEPGDVFRRGKSGWFRVLDVFPPACGLVPIKTIPQTWGGIKAFYR